MTLAGVYAAVAYYHDHRETINAEIAYCEKDTRSIREIIAALVLIWAVYSATDC